MGDPAKPFAALILLIGVLFITYKVGTVSEEAGQIVFTLLFVLLLILGTREWFY